MESKLSSMNWLPSSCDRLALYLTNFFVSQDGFSYSKCEHFDTCSTSGNDSGKPSEWKGRPKDNWDRTCSDSGIGHGTERDLGRL